MEQSREYKLSPEELEKMQKIELEMLIEVDRICRKRGIAYSLDGGTLLGAVRHKGFIPWDDDVDVIMLREEYEKFRKICETELDTERFFLQDYRSDPNYRWGWAKLRRNHTEQIRFGQESLKQRTGVFIDIFVADNVPDNPIFRRLHHFCCYVLRKSLYAPLGIQRSQTIFERGIYLLLNKLPRESAFALRNRMADRCNKKETELISHYMFEYPKRCRYGLPRRCFSEFIELEFEGAKFSAFKEYDIYLSMHYGDYMELPPEEERVSHMKLSKLDMTGVKI